LRDQTLERARKHGLTDGGAEKFVCLYDKNQGTKKAFEAAMKAAQNPNCLVVLVFDVSCASVFC
jgi:hypothetical protein